MALALSATSRLGIFFAMRDSRLAPRGSPRRCAILMVGTSITLRGQPENYLRIAYLRWRGVGRGGGRANAPKLAVRAGLTRRSDLSPAGGRGRGGGAGRGRRRARRAPPGRRRPGR